MENDARSRPDGEAGAGAGPATFVRTVTTVAIVAFALLAVTDGRRVLPFALGIAGLMLVGAALMAMDGFRTEWRRSQPASNDTNQHDITESGPLLVEAGLWALGALFVIQLVEIARG